MFMLCTGYNRTEQNRQHWESDFNILYDISIYKYFL